MSRSPLPPSLPAPLAFVLAGGRGSRLHELTDSLCKPAVPFGDRCRIVDFTMENIRRSGLPKVVVATQYRSAPLEAHLSRAWSKSFLDGGLHICRAPPGHSLGKNCGGTAGAVWRNAAAIDASDAREILILSADHVYAMDYRRLIDAHRASGAAITVSAQAVPKVAARGFGVIGATPDGRIARFVEKPSNPPTLPGRPDFALASMGVYVCSWPWLRATLERDALCPTSGHDFGQDILPAAVADGVASVFDWSQENGRPTFWRDVGTLDSLLDTCLEFQVGPAPCPLPNVHPATSGLEAVPALSEPIGGVRLARPSASGWAVVKDSVLLAGCRLASGCRLTRTILAPGTVLPPGLIVGEDARADSLWCRVTDNGTRLVTPAMLAQRARRLASAPPWLSTRPAAQMEGVAVGGVAV